MADNKARDSNSNANTIAFDAGTFDRLIAFLTDCKKEVDDQFLDAHNEVPLSDELSTYLRPGSKDWDVVAALLERAGKFGDSAFTKLDALSTEWGKYIHALIDAKAVFEKSNDLATMSASDFVTKFPALGSSGPLTPPPGAGA